MSDYDPARRRLLTAGLVGASSLAVSGCDAFDMLTDRDNPVRNFIEGANGLTYRAQRILLGRDALAKEFTRADIRQPQRPNGVTNPPDEDYKALAANDFRGYRLEVRGMVSEKLSLSLDELQAMPLRTQITRHDCVEGWSCIAEWSGVPLSAVLERAEPAQGARFVVFHCFDTIERGLSGNIRYYESIDMMDAYHPQTILAYGLNRETLPVSNGAPLRLRVERQLGYKMAKYVRAIELVDRLTPFGLGKGGYWEDRGYDWYAGI
ncbi:molybdopterin-binding protein [Oricola sp.]|uniref:molybdopterin-binding protein n=1 Tax=Oricola sp. TaxID=1979950 RepID=UPI003512C8D8